MCFCYLWDRSATNRLCCAIVQSPGDTACDSVMAELGSNGRIGLGYWEVKKPYLKLVAVVPHLPT